MFDKPTTKQIKKKAIRLSFFLNLMFSEEAAPATIHRGYFSKNAIIYKKTSQIKKKAFRLSGCKISCFPRKQPLRQSIGSILAKNAIIYKKINQIKS